MFPGTSANLMLFVLEIFQQLIMYKYTTFLPVVNCGRFQVAKKFKTMTLT